MAVATLAPLVAPYVALSLAVLVVLVSLAHWRCQRMPVGTPTVKGPRNFNQCTNTPDGSTVDADTSSEVLSVLFDREPKSMMPFSLCSLTM